MNSGSVNGAHREESKKREGEKWQKAKIMISIGFSDVFRTKNTKSVEMHI